MNDDITYQLRILSNYYGKERDYFRRNAYENSIRSINKLNFKITDINQVKNVKGIGSGILKKIKEYLEKGVITKTIEIQNIINNQDDIINLFSKIWGVGEVKATKLWDKGYTNLDQLRDDPEVLNRQQQIGLKYYDDLLKKIPRINITVIQTIIIYMLNETYGRHNYKIEIAGSYRRGKDYSNDIDVLITSDKFNLKDVVYLLKKWKVVTDILSMRNEKFMGVGNCPNTKEHYFRIDIEFVPKDQFPFTLLYFTGSKDFNREMRWHAKKLGYKLNEHGLLDIKNNRYIPAINEKEIFDILSLEYVIPKDRN